jgi:histone H3/H4
MAKDKEISINFSTVKKMLVATGCRTSKDAVLYFQKQTNKWMAEKAKAAGENTTARGAKTIDTKDLERLFE